MGVKLKKRKDVLGKGLGALLPDTKPTKDKNEVPVNTILDIPLHQIETNPEQPRRDFESSALMELAESIKIYGLIQPITVRKLDSKTYQLISGERRFRAAKLISLTSLPCYVLVANEQQMLEMALIENTHRQDLNAIEIADSYRCLIEQFGLKQDDLAERVGKNRTTVTNYLRLLKLPDKIKAGLRDKKISMGHARALISLEEIDKQLAIYDKIIDEKLSVRQVEELARGFQPKKPKQKSQVKEDHATKQLQSDLSSRFGTKVRVKRNKTGKGEIKIPFTSDEDLNRILEFLQD